MDRGSLQSYLRSNEGSITLAQQLYWISDLISAVVYLRQMNVIHRDVAARNILLNQRMKAKLRYNLRRRCREPFACFSSSRQFLGQVDVELFH